MTFYRNLGVDRCSHRPGAHAIASAQIPDFIDRAHRFPE
jgi:hypothetical protein